MGAGFADFTRRLADAVLNDGTVTGLGPTDSTQLAIIELVNAAITSGAIPISGTGVSAVRDAPCVEHHMGAAAPSQAWGAVLKPAVQGTAPTFVAGSATASGNPGAGQSLSIAKPAGMVNGDVLIAYVLINSTSSGILAPGSGWNWAAIDLNEGLPLWGTIMWRVVDGTEPTNIGFVTPGGGFMEGFLWAFRGVDHTNPFNAGPAFRNNNQPSGPADSNNNSSPPLAGPFDAVGKALFISGFAVSGGTGHWTSAASPPGGNTVTVNHLVGNTPDDLAGVSVLF